MFRNIRWRIAVPYVLLVALMMISLMIYLGRFLREMYVADLKAQLLSETRLAGDELGRSWHTAWMDELDTLVRRWAGLVEARFTVIAPDGTVLADSHEDRTHMDNHLWRPEVQQALANGQGTSMRFSDTLGYEMMYTAVPVIANGEVVAIVRVARPLRQVEIHMARLRQSILLVTMLISAIAVLLALVIVERTVEPIRRLTREADRMAGGDLDVSAIPVTHDEVGQLGRAFSRMAALLREKMTALEEEKSLLAAILASMADGALIVDRAGQVLLINPAAAKLLGTTQKDAEGRSFVQVARQHRVIELVRHSQEAGQEKAETVELRRQG
ncbi:MAG: HAMP domain-containing protein, partial [Chloroflexi bacterium]|nr:HAMP domain-containing protein [Chloroflexota bacterium]